MIKGLYSVRDRLTGYMQPALETTDAEAVRNFEHAVLNSGSLLLSHPQDYCLVRLAWFDTVNGTFLTKYPGGDDDSLCPSSPLADAAHIVLREQAGGNYVQK